MSFISLGRGGSSLLANYSPGSITATGATFDGKAVYRVYWSGNLSHGTVVVASSCAAIRVQGGYTTSAGGTLLVPWPRTDGTAYAEVVIDTADSNKLKQSISGTYNAKASKIWVDFTYT